MENNYEMKDSKQRGRGRPREFDRSEALHKALKVFWEYGYIQTTMNQLCQAMGIKSPSLYCAFGSKAELFLEALAFYRRVYWEPVFKKFLEEKDLYEATKNLFDSTARILLSPAAPCGCLTVFSALTLPANERRILRTISEMRANTQNIFRTRLENALQEGQIPEVTDISALAGALCNFFEGLTLQAREQNKELNELLRIAEFGVVLLPKKN